MDEASERYQRLGIEPQSKLLKSRKKEKRRKKGRGRDIEPLNPKFTDHFHGQVISTRLFINSVRKRLNERYEGRHWLRVRELEFLFHLGIQERNIAGKVSKSMIREWLRRGLFDLSGKRRGTWKLRKTLWLLSPASVRCFLNRLEEANNSERRITDIINEEGTNNKEKSE